MGRDSLSGYHKDFSSPMEMGNVEIGHRLDWLICLSPEELWPNGWWDH